MSLQANLEPENPQVQQLQFRIAAIQELDKGLELQMRRIDTQREAITTELEAVRKVITVNITSSFKIFS
jgi:capsule polysaccharide export protein KpsE/RkpR